MKYAVIDESGKMISAVNDETISTIPKDCITLTDRDWDKRYSIYWDGSSWKDSVKEVAVEEISYDG